MTTGGERRKLYLIIGLIIVAVLVVAWFVMRGGLLKKSSVTNGPAVELFSALPGDFLFVVPAVVSSEEKRPDGTIVIKLNSKTLTPNMAVLRYTTLLRNNGWRISNKFEIPNQIITATSPTGDILTLKIDLRITGVAGTDSFNTAISAELKKK